MHHPIMPKNCLIRQPTQITSQISKPVLFELALNCLSIYFQTVLKLYVTLSEKEKQEKESFRLLKIDFVNAIIPLRFLFCKEYNSAGYKSEITPKNMMS